MVSIKNTFQKNTSQTGRIFSIPLVQELVQLEPLLELLLRNLGMSLCHHCLC